MLTFAGRSQLETSVGYRGASFGHSDYDIDDRGKPEYEPSLDDAVKAGKLPEPTGFRDGYRAPFAGARLVLDSQRGKSTRSDGTRLDISAEQSVDLANPPISGWLRYGGNLSGFVDLNGYGRMLQRVVDRRARRSDRRPRSPVHPARVAGRRPHDAGSAQRSRLYDRSALVATVRYSWPIWLALQRLGAQLGVGNVFGAHFFGAASRPRSYFGRPRARDR